MNFRIYIQTVFSLMLFSTALPSAAIMKPESSMLFIKEAEGGGSMNVQNQEDREALLYVKILNLPDDPQPKLFATQPVTRVGAHKTQRVRFILVSERPLQQEHLKRVVFEGIHPKKEGDENTIDLNIRHNIPVIIHPKGLPIIADPWKELVWSLQGKTLTVNNSGKYVVRLAQEITLLPSNKTALLEKAYILPGQSLKVQVKTPEILASTQKVSIETLSKYGYETGMVEMDITH
nr:fimbria/pilus chaperone family protein [uncultured Erwinia sp.]